MEKEVFLRSRGWDTWYHHDYWVHPKMITDPNRQDYTDYGLSKECAFDYEFKNEKV